MWYLEKFEKRKNSLHDLTRLKCKSCARLKIIVKKRLNSKKSKIFQNLKNVKKIRKMLKKNVEKIGKNRKKKLKLEKKSGKIIQ